MIQINEIDVEVTVTPAGDIAANHVEEVDHELVELLHYQYKHIIIDFKNVEMIDSMGISTLVSSKNKLKRYGGELSLINVLPEIASMFSLMNLDKHFSVTSG